MVDEKLCNREGRRESRTTKSVNEFSSGALTWGLGGGVGCVLGGVLVGCWGGGCWLGGGWLWFFLGGGGKVACWGEQKRTT